MNYYHLLNPSLEAFADNLGELEAAFKAKHPDNEMSVTWGTVDGVVMALVKAPGGSAQPEGFTQNIFVRPLATEIPGTPLRRVYGLVTNNILREVLITTSHVIIGCAVWTVPEWRAKFSSGGVLAEYGADAQAWGEEHLESVLAMAEPLQASQ